jgi:alpha-beta hydrolase superfamily lysophospholipase
MMFRSFAVVVTAVAFAAALFAATRGGATAQARDPLPRHAVLGAAVAADPGGVAVSAVVPGSAAASAGVQRGDVVTTIDGAPVGGVTQFLDAIRRRPGGTTVAFGIRRAGSARTLSVTLGTAPNEHDPAFQTLYESVSIDGSLRRTLLGVPAVARGRLPAVMLVGGIGCFSVDVATSPDDGYRRAIADITKAGFATLRLEKSGVGDSQGPPCHDVDFATEYHSYEVALDALKRDPHVDPARVYLLGHSIGSVIAPRLALAHPVAGVIASEAVGRDWFEYELANLRRQLVLGGDSPDVVDAKLQSKERCMHALLIERRAEPEIERAEPDCKTRNGIYPVADAYVQQVAALNIIEPWTRLTVPVDVIYGTSDYVVAREDHVRIVDVVNRAHPGNATLQVIDGMDHTLRVAATPAIFYENSAKGVAAPYDAAFSTAVIGWLCNRERCR